LPSGSTPGVTTDKLYNVGGALYWNGAALGMAGSAGGWTDGGANVYLTTSTDKVGIGTSTPEFKLSLYDDGGIKADGKVGSGATLSAVSEGAHLIWYPRKASFRTGYVGGDQWDDANVGDYSTAMGNMTKASASYSFATGFMSVASGNLSTAMGYQTRAESISDVAIGRFNVGGGTADAWIAGDPLFEIGIGTDALSKADAVTVLKNGNVGIGASNPVQKLEVSGKLLTLALQVGTSATAGHVLTADASGNAAWQAVSNASGWTDGGSNVYTTTSTDMVGIGTSSPEFKLTLDNDGGILAKGTFASGAILTTTGEGARLIWYPRKAAFRAGDPEGSRWDDSNVGNYSAAMGMAPMANGVGSTAIGIETIASGQGSTAMGNGTTASSDGSTAMGISTTANGGGSLATGIMTNASGSASTCMGNRTTASGYLSTAMGDHTTAASYLSLAIGTYNVGGGSVDTWAGTDPIFEIGNGWSASNRSNLLTVRKNGNIGCLNSSPGYLLTMEASGGGYYDVSDHQWHNGSSRVIKRDIQPNAMDVRRILDQVEVVNYRYKTEVQEDPDAPFHIGFIADDTPVLLSGKKHDGMATGDCIGLLLAVVKEQQRTAEDQQKHIEDLESQIRAMKK
jgi:hypothetical protein